MKLTVQIVYFIYPETRGVRLEDMNRLFNDAPPSEMPTPQSIRGETGSLIRNGSPIPSMDLRRGSPAPKGKGQADNESNMDVDPPHVDIRDGVPRYSSRKASGDATRGLMSRMTSWARSGGSASGARDGRYKPLDQQDD